MERGPGDLGRAGGRVVAAAARSLRASRNRGTAGARRGEGAQVQRLHRAQPYLVGEEDAAVLRTNEQAIIRMAVLEAVKSWRPQVTEAEMLDAIDACNHDGSSDCFWALDPIDGTKIISPEPTVGTPLTHGRHPVDPRIVNFHLI